MAGEIQEPFRLDFQVDYVHSGSISFGRYENEALCWERRSSFSHNRYLEEVEKCSKPGSVTQKKAYFEAHFRKKGLLGLNLSGYKIEDEYDGTSKDDISEKMGNSEENGLMNDATHSDRFEEAEVLKVSFSEPPVELANDLDCTDNHVKAVNADNADLESSFSTSLKSEIDDKDSIHGDFENLDELHANQDSEEKAEQSPEDLQVSSPKERAPLKVEHMKPRLNPKDIVDRRRQTPRNAPKVVEKMANKAIVAGPKMHKISQSLKNGSICETSKHKNGLKTKGVNEISRVEKQLKNKPVVGPQPATSEKISSRVNQSASRVSPAVSASKQHTREDISRFSFKSDERAQRRKEFDMKREENLHAKEAKMHQIQTMCQEKKTAEIKQLRKSLNFKAIPMPSFYRRASLEPADGNKAIPRNINQEKQRFKSPSPGVRTSEKHPPVSVKVGPISRASDPRATSSHSTVTSDSGASSHCVTSKNRYPWRPAAGSASNKTEAAEKKTNFRGSGTTYKGKSFDGKMEMGWRKRVGATQKVCRG